MHNRKEIFRRGVISNYGLKVVSLVVNLLFVPVFLNYFGDIRYGVWAIIFSISAYLGLSNLGVNTATAVLVAKAIKPFEQWLVIKRSILILTVSVALILACVWGINTLYPNWITIMGNIPYGFEKEAKEATFIFAVLFLMNIPLTVFSSGFIGMQKVYWERFYSALQSIANLVALFLTMIIRGNLINMVWFRGLLVVAISVICAFHFFRINSFSKNINIGKISSKEFSTRAIFTTSLRFFSLAIAAIISWNINNFIISHSLGIKAVTPYSVAFRLVSIVFILFFAVNSATFPMWGRAVALNQFGWMQSVYNKITYLLPIIGGGIWLGMIAFSREIISLWVGAERYGGFLLIFALGGYGFLLSLEHVHANLISGINAIKGTIFIGWTELIISAALSIFLVRQLGIGGAALGLFLGSFLTGMWMFPIAVSIKTQRKINFNFVPVLIIASVK